MAAGAAAQACSTLTIAKPVTAMAVVRDTQGKITRKMSLQFLSSQGQMLLFTHGIISAGPQNSRQPHRLTGSVGRKFPTIREGL